MKKIIPFVLLIVCCISINAHTETPSPLTILPVNDPQSLISNELTRLDTLIEATEQSWAAQKKLRGQIVEYQKIQEQFFNRSQDNDVLLRLIKSAYLVLNSIKENHLAHTFDSDFINELTIISQPATKRGVPKSRLKNSK